MQIDLYKFIKALSELATAIRLVNLPGPSKQQRLPAGIICPLL